MVVFACFVLFCLWCQLGWLDLDYIQRLTLRWLTLVAGKSELSVGYFFFSYVGFSTRLLNYKRKLNKRFEQELCHLIFTKAIRFSRFWERKYRHAHFYGKTVKIVFQEHIVWMQLLQPFLEYKICDSNCCVWHTAHFGTTLVD